MLLIYKNNIDANAQKEECFSGTQGQYFAYMYMECCVMEISFVPLWIILVAQSMFNTLHDRGKLSGATQYTSLLTSASVINSQQDSFQRIYI